MIEIGDIVRTSYGTGPYRVVEIVRDCCCPAYLDTLNYRNPPASPPHFHLTLVKADCPIGKEPQTPGGKGFYWLNGYAEKGGRYVNVWGGFYDGRKDEIIVEGHAAGAQLELFA